MIINVYLTGLPCVDNCLEIFHHFKYIYFESNVNPSQLNYGFIMPAASHHFHTSPIGCIILINSSKNNAQQR